MWKRWVIITLSIVLGAFILACDAGSKTCDALAGCPDEKPAPADAKQHAPDEGGQPDPVQGDPNPDKTGKTVVPVTFQCTWYNERWMQVTVEIPIGHPKANMKREWAPDGPNGGDMTKTFGVEPGEVVAITCSPMGKASGAQAISCWIKAFGAILPGDSSFQRATGVGGAKSARCHAVVPQN